MLLRSHLGRAVFGAFFGLLALCFVLVTPASATNPNPRVLPPNARAFGETYGSWSAAWWQYVVAQPASTNPLLPDNTGANCRVGQSGRVFFLVGVSGGTATRNQCTVPAGKALFFPLVNGFDVHVACAQAPNLCDTQDTPEKIWNDFQITFAFQVFTLHAKIDGVPISNLEDPVHTPYRACAGPDARCSAPSFPMTVPAENILGLPPGTYAPAVADGVYLLLAPLPVGLHTITFGGSGNLGNTFTVDTTYHFLVSPT
jgi:hypothetical protein